MTKDLDYFRMRASQEREAALQSPCAAAQRTHREMAKRYDALIASLEGPQPMDSGPAENRVRLNSQR